MSVPSWVVLKKEIPMSEVTVNMSREDAYVLYGLLHEELNRAELSSSTSDESLARIEQLRSLGTNILIRPDMDLYQKKHCFAVIKIGSRYFYGFGSKRCVLTCDTLAAADPFFIGSPLLARTVAQLTAKGKKFEVMRVEAQ
jgi:hypothetical protein